MTDFQILQKLNSEQFSQLLKICFEFISGKQSSQCLTMYKKFSDSCNIELSEVEPTIKSILKISKDAIKLCKTVSQLQDELLNLGINEDHVQVFIKQWEKEYSALAQATAEDTIEINPLLDMEWKFGVTSASSELSTVGNVFLQLKLEVDKGNSKSESVCFELQLPEFYAFLHEMERARASLEYLS